MLERYSLPFIHFIDRIYHVLTRWINQAVWQGLIVSTVLSACAVFLLTGSTGLPNISSWAFLSLLIKHPEYIAVLMVLSGLYACLWIGHLLYQHPPTGDLLPLEPVASLTLNMMHLDPRPVAYYSRIVYRELCHTLHVRWQRRQTVTAVVLSGRAAVGKTRMLYELMRGQPLGPSFRRAWYLTGNEVPTRLSSVQLQQIRHRHIVVLFDDVERHLEQAKALVQSLPTWRKARQLTILMTCQTHAVPLVSAVFRPLQEAGGEIKPIEPIQQGTPEWTDFLTWARTVLPAADIHEQNFDGTPGSLIFDLKQRIEELGQAPDEVRAVLQSCAILREAGVITWTVERVQRIAMTIFGVTSAQWNTALPWLARENWIQWQGTQQLTIASDALLGCLQSIDHDAYPAVGRTILDDVPRAVDALAQEPMDIEALVQISDRVHTLQDMGEPHLPPELDAVAILKRTLTSSAISPHSQDQAKLQLRCGVALVEHAEPAQAIPLLEAARTTFNQDLHPLEWAAATNQLGVAHQATHDADRSGHIEHAIEHFEESIQVFQKETHPFAWADTEIALADLYEERKEGDRAENLDRGIHKLESATHVYTRQEYPRQWASIQTKLGNFYRERVRGWQWRNQERSAQALRSAVAVYKLNEHEAGRLEYARALTNLGNAYEERTLGSRRRNQEVALENLQQSVHIFEEFLATSDVVIQPNPRIGWARAHIVIGKVTRERLEGNALMNYAQSIKALTQALEFLSDKHYFHLWAWATLELGLTYARKETIDDYLRANDCFTQLLRDDVKAQGSTRVIWTEAALASGMALLALTKGAQDQQSRKLWSAYRSQGRAVLNQVGEVFLHDHDRSGLRTSEDLLRRFSALTYEDAA